PSVEIGQIHNAIPSTGMNSSGLKDRAVQVSPIPPMENPKRLDGFSGLQGHGRPDRRQMSRPANFNAAKTSPRIYFS
ncbi:MAG: hypothetical protein VXZ53_01385, partial [Planctomycetota bacterium]|nr:hypothetical protein [Planctomycetota bacterium]